MLSVNHGATGMAIALAVKQPVLSIPLAFVSHFVLDVLPHFGYKDEKGFGKALKHKLTYFVLFLDFIGWLILLIATWFLPIEAYIAAFAAVSPDLFWLYKYFFLERTGKAKPGEESSKFNQFHSRIQKLERQWGLAVEIGYFILILIVVRSLM